MEQNSVIYSENACVLIHENKDTVLKFSVVCSDFCYFSPLIWEEFISQMHISLMVFNLNLYDNHDRDRNCNRNRNRNRISIAIQIEIEIAKTITIAIAIEITIDSYAHHSVMDRAVSLLFSYCTYLQYQSIQSSTLINDSTSISFKIHYQTGIKLTHFGNPPKTKYMISFGKKIICQK